jgi:2-dehydropantoate 2-reductase
MATDPSRQPRVLVYGAGAVGCFLGGVLAETGCSVTLLGRAERAQAVRTRGLRIERPRRTASVRPRFIESANQLDVSPDVVLLTTKTYAVSEALPDLRRILAPASTLVTVQNGIGTEELIQNELPESRLVAASLTLSAKFSAPEEVSSTSRSGGIALAPVSSGADTRSIARLFYAAGIPTTMHRNYRSMKWSKLVLNMMGNATSAILDWTPARIYTDPDLYKLERAAILEAVDIIRAEGSSLIFLPGFPVPVLPWVLRLPPALGQRLLESRVGGGRGAKMPSLHLELNAGSDRTEVDWLYGAVVHAGKRLSVPTPVNRRLLTIYAGVRRSRVLREAFRSHPERLLRNAKLGADP